MFRSPLRLALAVLGFAVLGPAAHADSRSTMVRREKEVREKIAQLFEQRDNPIPRLVESQNPFYRSEPTLLEPEPNPTPEDPAAFPEPAMPADERLLLALVPSLHIHGMIELEKRKFIILNSTTVPAGGVAVVEFQGLPRLLRVESIGVSEATISYGSARVVLTY